MERVGDGRERLHHHAARMERIAHLLERHPGLALDDRLQRLGMRLEDRPAITADLGRGCTARFADTLHQLDSRRRAHLKPNRCSSGRSSAFDKPDDPLAQILGQRCRHRELRARNCPTLLNHTFPIPCKSEPL
jgi:hypothetical protein